MKWACVFALSLVFSCQGPEIRNRHEESIESAHSNQQNVDLEERFAITPLQQRVLAFPGVPVAIPVRIVRRGTTELSAYPFPGSCRVITSDGGSVNASIHWLRTLPRVALATQRISEIPQSPSASIDPSVPDDVSIPHPVFPWVESDIRLVAASPPVDQSQGSDRVAFLVIANGALLPAGLARVDESTFTVDHGELLTQPAADADFDRCPNDGDWWAQPDLTFPLESFRRDLLTRTGRSRFSHGPSHPGSDLRNSNDQSSGPGATSGSTLLLTNVLSRQTAARFRYGLSKLQGISPGVADTVIEDLTRTCKDGRFSFAAWRTGIRDLAELEERLLSDPRAGREGEWAAGVLAWAEEDPIARAWIESSHGPVVRLAIANLSTVDESFRLQWVDSGGSPPNEEVASFRIPGQTVYRTSIDREPVRSGRAASSLKLLYGDEVIQQFELPPAMTAVVPPGAQAGPAVRMWQIDSWMQANARAAPRVQQTYATIRMYDGRWQLVIDCRCTSETVGWLNTLEFTSDKLNDTPSNGTTGDSDGAQRRRASDESAASLARMLSMSELAGTEAITLFVGDFNRPGMICTFAPTGEERVWERHFPGDASKSLLEETNARIQPLDNGWTMTINIPDVWIAPEPGDAIEIGFIRTHHEMPYADCYPRACLPWRMNPGRVRYDLTSWLP